MRMDQLGKRLAKLEERMTPPPPRKIYICTARDGHVDEDVAAYFESIGVEQPNDDDDDLTIVRTIVLVGKTPVARFWDDADRST